VKLVISDAHEGLKAAAANVPSATWRRCRVYFMTNALAHVGAKQRQMVAAAIRTAFTQETETAAHTDKEKSDSELVEHYLLAQGPLLTNLGILCIGRREHRAGLR
jgi:putative transposase